MHKIAAVIGTTPKIRTDRPYSKIDGQLNILTRRLKKPPHYLRELGIEDEVRFLIKKYGLDLEKDFIEPHLLHKKADKLSNQLELKCSGCSYNSCKKENYSNMPSHGLIVPIDDVSLPKLKDEAVDLDGIPILPKDIYGCTYYNDVSDKCENYKNRTLYCRLWPIELFPDFGYGAYNKRFYNKSMDIIIGMCGGLCQINNTKTFNLKREAAKIFVSIPTLIKSIQTIAIKQSHAYLSREMKPRYQ